MNKPSKHQKLKCSLQVRAMIFGEENQKVKNTLTIMDLTDSLLHLKNKNPENQSLLHSHLIITRERRCVIHQ